MNERAKGTLNYILPPPLPPPGRNGTADDANGWRRDGRGMFILEDACWHVHPDEGDEGANACIALSPNCALPSPPPIVAPSRGANALSMNMSSSFSPGRGRTSDISDVADVSTGGDKLPQGSDNRVAFVLFIRLSLSLFSFPLRSFSAISHHPSPSVSFLFAHIHTHTYARTHTMRGACAYTHTRAYIYRYMCGMAVPSLSPFFLRATSVHRFNGFS